MAFSVFTSMLITIVIGFFLYSFLDAARVDIYCPNQLREGGDCYAEGWELFFVWVTSMVGASMAIISVVLASLFQPRQRIKAAKVMLVVGAICAVPFALLIQSAIALVITILSGLFSLWCVKRLTIRSSKDALKRAA